MESVLVFKIDEKHFAINVSLIKWVITLDRIHPVMKMPEYVIGEIEHGGDVYFLICLRKLLDLGECKELEQKSVIIIEISGRHFALLVDEIEQIEEIKKDVYHTDALEFYNFDGVVVEELRERFFQKFLKIPTLDLKTKSEKSTEVGEYESFLMFRLGEHTFALESSVVKYSEILDKEQARFLFSKESEISGTYLSKEKILHLVDLKKCMKIDGEARENVLVLQKEHARLALLVDEILDIVYVDSKHVAKSHEKSIVDRYFVYDGSIVAVLAKEFLDKLFARYAVEQEGMKEEIFSQKELSVFLLVEIKEHVLAFDLRSIERLYEEDEVTKATYLGNNPYIEALVTVGNSSYYLINFERLLLEKKQDGSCEGKSILVVKVDEKSKVALCVEKIYDLIYIDSSLVEWTKEDESFIKGTILYNGSIIDIFNPKFLLKEEA